MQKPHNQWVDLMTIFSYSAFQQRFNRFSTIIKLKALTASGIEWNNLSYFGINSYFYATKKAEIDFMIEFAGTYSATIDDKGRIVLPASFKKELGDLANESLVVEKNLHKACLDIHPEKFWRKRVDAYLEYANLEKGAEFIGMGESIRLLSANKDGIKDLSKAEFLQKLKERRQKKA